MIIVFHLLAGSSVWADSVATVNRAQFKEGNYWRWLYSEWDKESHQWKPYYIEKYTVTDENEDLITIEMSSSPASSMEGPPHHKFILDFNKCRRAAKNPRFKNFTVELYTRSLGQNWELVSRSHKNLIFTEKFNCETPFPHQKVVYQDQTYRNKVYRTFQVNTQPPRKRSWYFLNLPEDLKGVAFSKEFPPSGQYRLEILDYKTNSK